MAGGEGNISVEKVVVLFTLMEPRRSVKEGSCERRQIVAQTIYRLA